MLAINREDDADSIKAYVEKNRFTFRPLRDKEGEVGKAYRVDGYPTTYVIGPDGRIASRMFKLNDKLMGEVLDKVAPEKK